jgi:hypothetical protein
MKTRKLLPAVIGLILPVAAMTVTPAMAQAKSHKHHVTTHKVAHKITKHSAPATKAS